MVATAGNAQHLTTNLTTKPTDDDQNRGISVDTDFLFSLCNGRFWTLMDTHPYDF
jgi:hypothetical protein